MPPRQRHPHLKGQKELVLPLDTSSQTSVEGMEASVESNPAEVTLVTAARSSQSDSPVQDLQLEVHSAIKFYIYC